MHLIHALNLLALGWLIGLGVGAGLFMLEPPSCRRARRPPLIFAHAHMPADSQTWLARFVIGLMRPFVRLIYKIKVEGLENLPREGGVIVAPNHLSYVDVVLLAVVSPRPLRTMAWGGFQRYAFLRAVFRVFGSLAVTPEHAKTAIKEAVEILQGGSVVMIFPRARFRARACCSPSRAGSI